MSVKLSGTCRPTKLMRRLQEHRGDVSSSDMCRLIAKRNLLGQTVRFYTSGEHVIEGSTLPLADQYDSELLKFAHASLLVNGPVGDKRKLWVDATTDPCQVWIEGHSVVDFLRRARRRVMDGTISVAELFESEDPLRKV